MPGETEKLRRPLFIAAYVLLAVTFCLEIGAGLFGAPDRKPTDDSIAAMQSGFSQDAPSADKIRGDVQHLQDKNGAPPGYAIPYLGFIDGILMLSMTWMLLALFIPQRIQGQLQGVVTFVIALLIAVFSIITIFVTLTILTGMLGLFFAAPFGTLVYFAIWGFFNVGSAKTILSLSMLLKIVFAIVLVLSNQRFLKVKSMIGVIVTSLVLNFIAALLIGIVPSFLASITDAIAGIINAVAGLIWSLLLMVFSALSILRAIRVNRSTSAEG